MNLERRKEVLNIKPLLRGSTTFVHLYCTSGVWKDGTQKWTAKSRGRYIEQWRQGGRGFKNLSSDTKLGTIWNYLTVRTYFHNSYVLSWQNSRPNDKNIVNLVASDVDIEAGVSSSVFCPRAGPLLQAQEPRLQFCRRQLFHRKLRNQGCNVTSDWIGAVATHCFSHPTLSLAS